MTDQPKHPPCAACRGASPSSRLSNRTARTIALVVASLIGLLGTLSAPAGTPAQHRTERIKADIVTLKKSVGRGDKPAAERVGASIERDLTALHDEITALPSLRLAVGKQTAIVKYLGDRVPGVRLAGVLVTQAGISEDLAALGAHVVAHRRYRLDKTHEVSLRYYPPGELYVVQDVLRGKPDSRFDFLSLLEREQRLGPILTRARELEAAWRKADRLSLVVKPEIAKRLGLDTDGLRVRYLHTGVVSPDGSPERTYSDLLREVQSQIEYIVNVKPEGPPLIAALETGLFFDEEFGFEAWGGRWPEFAGTIFFLRYGPATGEFLVRLARMTPSTAADG